RIATIHRGAGNDETDIEFLPDGRLLATARLEVTPDSIRGHADAGTAIVVAAPPYTDWERTGFSQVTRLDGPALFRLDDTIFAVARHQPEPRGRLTRLGGALARQRTAIFRLQAERLAHLTHPPRAGHAPYPGGR